MNLDALAKSTAGWLEPTGPEAAVVLSSRVRLARNLRGIPFPHRATDESRRITFDRVTQSALETGLLTQGAVWDFGELPEEDRRLFVERHLASTRLLEGRGPRGVVTSVGETLGLQVNEEDHVRIQAMVSGLNLPQALKEAVDLDRALETRLDYATLPERGYLTACPTNVGTGLRASVLIHLPALVLAGEVKKVHRAVSEMGMAVRGWSGEGSAALGDYHQLSNQRTLGKTEEESVLGLDRVVRRVLELELEARRKLREDRFRRRRLEDRIHRSHGVLTHARLLTIEMVMTCVSDLRLGRWMGIVEDFSESFLGRISLFSQSAHLARSGGGEMDEEEERWRRAEWIRAMMRSEGSRSAG